MRNVVGSNSLLHTVSVERGHGRRGGTYKNLVLVRKKNRVMMIGLGGNRNGRRDLQFLFLKIGCDVKKYRRRKNG